MKTKIAGLVCLLAMAFASFAFTACSNDDDEGGGDSRFVGAWGLTLYEDLDEDGNVTSSSTEDKMRRILVLEADGTGYDLERNPDGSYRNGKGSDNYRWKASGSSFSIDWNDGDGWTEWQVKEMSGSRLVLQYNGDKALGYPPERETYERVDISGLDIDEEKSGN